MQPSITESRLLACQLRQLVAQLRVATRGAVTKGRSWQLQHAARTPFTKGITLLQVLHSRLHCCELQPFFRITDCSASLSKLRSATSFFSRRTHRTRIIQRHSRLGAPNTGRGTPTRTNFLRRIRFTLRPDSLYTRNNRLLSNRLSTARKICCLNPSNPVRCCLRGRRNGLISVLDVAESPFVIRAIQSCISDVRDDSDDVRKLNGYPGGT